MFRGAKTGHVWVNPRPLELVWSQLLPEQNNLERDLPEEDGSPVPGPREDGAGRMNVNHTD